MFEKEEVLDLQEKVKALINGINPFTGEMVKTVNLEDPLIIRLLFNTYSALNMITYKRASKHKKEQFVFTKELEDKIEIKDEYLSLSRFLKQIKEKNNGIVPSHKDVSMFLVDEGYLEIDMNAENSSKKLPTAKGEEYEIKELSFSSYYGRPYKAVCYNRKGQTLLIEILKKYYS